MKPLFLTGGEAVSGWTREGTQLKIAQLEDASIERCCKKTENWYLYDFVEKECAGSLECRWAC